MNSTAAVHLYTLLQQRKVEGPIVTVDLPEDWGQGRTVFGGLLAALAVQAMRDVAGAHWPADVSLRALQTNFVGPLSVGTAHVEVHALREGKNVRQVKAVLRQGGETAAVFVGVFGSPRESSLPELMPERPAVAKSVDELPPLPFLPGITPIFTQHVEFRWAQGTPPFTGSSDWSTKIFLSLKAGDEHAAQAGASLAHLGELLTVIFADAAPTPALSRLTKPSPASSVSWALELRPLNKSVDLQGWWRVDKDALAVSQGYVNERSTLWAPDGSLAAFGYQVVTVYA